VESNVVRGYIETLLEMPWDKLSKDSKDIKNAGKILDSDHYGLHKVKERILEFLSVRALTVSAGKSPIICLVGPPGTGKTSIAKSVAKALNKKYIRISLGGVRDEAEIRGHRKTYVGAMPGRIASGLKQAGVKNPLMLLDEIDKMGSDYKGDPASALLEVLDSEQNDKFRDHYIELPIDLSEVLFIATANDVSSIERALLDRMEIIEISGYTINEKEHILKEHLLEKQKEIHGLSKKQLNISKSGIKKLITSYTREAGVRTLERTLGKICRKAAREILEDDKKTIKITEKNIEKYLGKEKYTYDMANLLPEVGIVRGLAWTSAGGDTLSIEVNIMKGKGEFLLTGKLGDVMKESAQTGISYIRSVADKYNIEEDFFKNHDIHIHIPEGAVPKDGPSAGITMATAMLSAITKEEVRADVAMTGEITLRGRVLPIGGLKEKILAAKMAGIKKVIVPFKNKRDLEEISEEIKSDINIIFAENMNEVIKEAFVNVTAIVEMEN
jgi:ATP-dependent Lon protease